MKKQRKRAITVLRVSEPKIGGILEKEEKVQILKTRLLYLISDCRRLLEAIDSGQNDFLPDQENLGRKNKKFGT
jgi:hypothetical protein